MRIIFLTIILLLTVQTSNAKTLKISIVNSYQCVNLRTYYQIEGFLNYLENSNTKNISFDMVGDITNTTKPEQYFISEKITKMIKDYDSKYTYCTGDIACRTICIPLSLRKNHDSICSGLIIPSKIYNISITNLHNVVLIFQNISMEPFWTYLQDNRYYPKKILIVADNNYTMSTAGYFLFQNIKKQIPSSIEYHVIFPKTLSELINYINDHDYSVIMLVLLRIDTTKGYITLDKIADQISKQDKITVAFNKELCKDHNIDICIDPQYYKMGKIAAKCLLNNCNKNIFIKSKVYINLDNLNKINAWYLLQNTSGVEIIK